MSFKQLTTFIFDFDSTLFPGETLDEIINCQLEKDPLANEKYEEIKRVCNLGMTGQILMEESLERRLRIATPTQQLIAKYVTENKNRIDLALQNILILLQASGHQVLVVSGGFEEWIVPLLEGIVPAENIHANQIKDASLPMLFDNIIIRQKETIIKELVLQDRLRSSEIIMIGDGATDYSVYEKKLAKKFIGTFFYSGQENRASIMKRASESQQPIFTRLDTFIDYLQLFV